MSRVVARLRQVGGGVRVVRAQDARHAAVARLLLADDPTWIDALDGVDGIRISVEDRS